MTDFPYQTSESVNLKRIQHGQIMLLEIEIVCGHAGCERTFCKQTNKGFFPTEFLVRMVSRSGWKSKPRKNIFLCPDHS